MSLINWLAKIGRTDCCRSHFKSIIFEVKS